MVNVKQAIQFHGMFSSLPNFIRIIFCSSSSFQDLFVLSGWDRRDEDDQDEPRSSESHESGESYLRRSLQLPKRMHLAVLRH